MPVVPVNDAMLFCEAAGPQHYAESILFLHGALLSGLMFAGVIAAFQHQYRCLTMDFRGQGRSPVAEGGYDMDSLAADAVAVIEQAGGPVHLVGAGMGGFVAMRVALLRPDLVTSLTLAGTSAEPEPAENMARWQLLGFAGSKLGARMVAGPAMRLLFGRSFLTAPDRRAERQAWRRRLAGNDRAGLRRVLAGVLQREGLNDALHRLATPTLVLAGDEDRLNRLMKAQRIQDRIPDCRLVVIAGAGPSLPIEQPAAVVNAVADFLSTPVPVGITPV